MLKMLSLLLGPLLFSHSVVSDSLWPHGLQHARLPCAPVFWSLLQFMSISSSVVPFSSRLQSFPTSGSFPMSRLFAFGGQSIGASASISVLPVNIQGWLVWSPCSPRDSQKSSPTPHFESINSSALRLINGLTLTVHDYWKNHCFDYTDLCWQSNVSAF